jgi:16S rRNA (guanine527-N7)-methyltransferase
MSAAFAASTALPPEAFGPEEFAHLSGVSRETLSRLKAYVSLLEEWNARHNLVSAGSLKDVWRRHVWDSAQLMAYIPPDAASLVDMGSGAGFPGLVLGLLLGERAGFRTVLYEATAKKCQFLAAVAQRIGVVADIRNARMEEADLQAFDVVTARACAPLGKLLGYAQHFRGTRTICLFLKGQSVDSELTEAHKSWSIKALRHQSRSDPSGVILEVREFHHDGALRSR